MELFDIVADATKTMADTSATIAKTNASLSSLSAEIDDVSRIAMAQMEELRLAKLRIKHLESDVRELRSCLSEAAADARDAHVAADCRWYPWAMELLR